MQRWGVPVEVVMPALGHNDPKPRGEWQKFVAITNMGSRLANFIEEERATMPFVQSPGVKPLMDFLKLKDRQVTDWEQAVRNKVKQMPAIMRG